MARTLMLSSSVRPSFAALLTVGLLGGPWLGAPAVAGEAVAEVTAARAADAPALAVERLIRTTPFKGTRTSMKDNEGSAYVPKDRTLWMVDDEGQRIFAVNIRTGALKRTIGVRALKSVRRFRGTAKAGKARSRDLESVAYDAARDRLYAFSGSDCWPSAQNCRIQSRPTAFRLDRRKGRLVLHSFQPLRTSRSDGAAWNPADRAVYVGAGGFVRRYDYGRNKYGAAVEIGGISEILGMDFTADGQGLLLTHNQTRLSLVDWRTKVLADGWSVDLAPHAVRDARGVAVAGSRYLVSDGADDRATSSAYRYAVLVFSAG